jgi:NAD(P)-dependent dehydrogenase (short-subunit alcohol dehydrogenase family)
MTDLAPPVALLALTGKVVIVTGSGGGIGTGIARRLSAAGASLVLHSRMSEVPSVDGPNVMVMADLVASDGPAQVVEAALSAFERLDGLVNNAGIQPVAPLLDVADDDFREMVETNLTAVHRLTRAAASAMTSGGSIIHIASIEATQPAKGHGHYAAAKAGLLMHARAAALEWGSRGIRVNSVSPGLIDRPGLDRDWPEGVERWMRASPLGRLGTPEDVGDACVFLLSDLARWISGTNLVVDGGVLANTTW